MPRPDFKNIDVKLNTDAKVPRGATVKIFPEGIPFQQHKRVMHSIKGI